MARILLISHEPEAAPALIGKVLSSRGHETVLHVVLADPTMPNTDFPDPTDFDAVVAFGSFANAYDETARRWVEPEVALIRQMTQEDVPYLGVCFGGQLLAESVGGHVERAPVEHQEIGLVQFDVDVAVPVPGGPWFTWHEDRMVLPDDVEVLAHNDSAIQLFRYGRSVGTQFHPEAEVPLVEGWLRIGPDHVPPHTTAAALLTDLSEHAPELQANCEALVGWFLADIAGVES